MDGFFSSIREKVGKQPFNTVRTSPSRADALEKQLLKKVRLFQFQFWFSGADIFQIFGVVRRAEREKPRSASMAALIISCFPAHVQAAFEARQA